MQFHGGQATRLTWHSVDALPVVTMSPIVVLKEGPDFSFNARWALLQYHPWTNRRQFLNAGDEAVKHHFRTWVQEPNCPWYVKEWYLEASARELRGFKKDQGSSKLGVAESYQ